MKQSNVIAGMVPDKRRPKEDGTFPLKLRVTFKGERKYYGTGFDLTLKDWEAIQSNSARGPLQKNRHCSGRN